MDGIIEFVDFVEEVSNAKRQPWFYNKLAEEILEAIESKEELDINPVNTSSPLAISFNILLPKFLKETNEIILGEDEEKEQLLSNYVKMKVFL